MSDEKDFDLRPNGKVWFMVGAQEHLCRRPTVGDLGKILELRAEMGTKEREALKAKPTGGQHLIFTTRMLSEWTSEALGMLSDHGKPAVDELPAWASSPELPDKLITHWQSVPLAPSGG